jgi:hypothetical protein
MRPHWATRKFPDVVAILCGDDRACGLAFPDVEPAKITVIHTVTMCRSDMARLEEHAFAWALFAQTLRCAGQAWFVRKNGEHAFHQNSPTLAMCRSDMVRASAA